MTKKMMKKQVQEYNVKEKTLTDQEVTEIKQFMSNLDDLHRKSEMILDSLRKGKLI